MTGEMADDWLCRPVPDRRLEMMEILDDEVGTKSTLKQIPMQAMVVGESANKLRQRTCLLRMLNRPGRWRSSLTICKMRNKLKPRRRLDLGHFTAPPSEFHIVARLNIPCVH